MRSPGLVWCKSAARIILGMFDGATQATLAIIGTRVQMPTGNRLTDHLGPVYVLNCLLAGQCLVKMMLPVLLWNVRLAEPS